MTTLYSVFKTTILQNIDKPHSWNSMNTASAFWALQLLGSMHKQNWFHVWTPFCQICLKGYWDLFSIILLYWLQCTRKHYMVKDTCGIHSSLLKLFFGPFSTSICYMNFALHSKSEPTWLFDAVNPLLINIYLVTIIEAKKASLFAVNVCFR